MPMRRDPQRLGSSLGSGIVGEQERRTRPDVLAIRHKQELSNDHTYEGLRAESLSVAGNEGLDPSDRRVKNLLPAS